MTHLERPILRCEAYGCEASYPPDEDIETYLSLHFPDGRHGLLERPLTEEELQSIADEGALEIELPAPGAEPAGLVFLCGHHAEAAIEFQRTGTSPPVVLDLGKAGGGDA